MHRYLITGLFLVALLLLGCIGEGLLQNFTYNSTRVQPAPANTNRTENTSLRIDVLGKDIFYEVNAERMKEGLDGLSWDDTIAAVARAYSNSTLLNGRPMHLNETLEYSIHDEITYVLYLYENCTPSGSPQLCPLLKHGDAISKVIRGWLNETRSSQALKFSNFTDAGIGVVANGSNVYITMILTDYQTWAKLKAAKGEGTRELPYTLRGITKTIKITMHPELEKLLAALPRHYYCEPVCPSARELELRYLDQKDQKSYLEGLAGKIKVQTDSKDDEARIAISLVQNIPYDEEGAALNKSKNRYPYEVIYDNKGVCGEKSRLLAFLLRDLGYGVALFDYEDENHIAVGIKCPAQYSYNNTGYCFIESTEPTIVTYNKLDYAAEGTQVSQPLIINISDGDSFTTASEEHSDAQEWVRIYGMYPSGVILNESDYSKWISLVNKYRIEFSS